MAGRDQPPGTNVSGSACPHEQGRSEKSRCAYARRGPGNGPANKMLLNGLSIIVKREGCFRLRGVPTNKQDGQLHSGVAIADDSLNIN